MSFMFFLGEDARVNRWGMLCVMMNVINKDALSPRALICFPRIQVTPLFLEGYFFFFSWDLTTLTSVCVHEVVDAHVRRLLGLVEEGSTPSVCDLVDLPAERKGFFPFLLPRP